MSKLKSLFEDLADYRTYAVRVDDYIDEIPTLDFYFTSVYDALAIRDVERNHPERFRKFCNHHKIEILSEEDFGIFVIRKKFPIDPRVEGLAYLGEWEFKPPRNPVDIDGNRIAVIGDKDLFYIYLKTYLVAATLVNISSPEHTYGQSFDDVITLDYYQRLPNIREILGAIKLRLRTASPNVVEKIDHLIQIN